MVPYRYYQPNLDLKPNHGPRIPRSSNDSILTAFAQLGALRLNANRGMISLAAREHQYIIAEATRTLSLQSDAVYEEDDALWKGETTVERSDGPTSVALDLFTGIIDGERDQMLVRDISVDKRFSHMESVTGTPFTKFYVAVPLVAPNGLVIGAFCVMDDKPRNGITDAQLAFMKEISSTIMAHLESKRLKHQHQRAERMIRGLGLYVEGKTSLREWWLKTGHKANAPEVNEKSRRGESLMQQADEEFGVQDEPDILASASIMGIPSTTQQRNFSMSEAKGAATNKPTRGRPQYAQDSYSDTTSASLTLSEAHDTAFTKQSEDVESLVSPTSSNSIQDPFGDAPFNSQHHSLDPQDGTSGAHLQEAVLSNELKQSFSRASNLIRESIGVDGALFLDASVGTFGGSSSKSNLGLSSPGAHNYQSTSFSTSSSDEARRRRQRYLASITSFNNRFTNPGIVAGRTQQCLKNRVAY